MRKKLLSMLLTLCLVLTLLPTMALATDPSPATSVTVGGKTLNASNRYATTDDAGVVTLRGDESTHNVKFEAATGTLTLRNANINASSNNPAISAANDLTIVAEGVNTVSNQGYSPTIQADNLNLQGTGTLTVISEQHIAVHANKSLTIGGNISLTAIGGTSADKYGGCGLYAGQIVIEDNATVTAAGGRSRAGGSGPVGSAGIFASDSVAIQDNASVTAVGGDTTEGGYSAGITSGLTASAVKFTGAITIGSSAKVVAVGGKSGSASYGLHADDGVGTGTITYTGGLLVAKGGSATTTSKAMNKALTNSGGDTVAPLSGTHDAKFAAWGDGGTYPSANILAATLDLSTWSDDTSNWNASTGGYKTETIDGVKTITLKNMIVNAPDGASGMYGIKMPNAPASIVLEGVNIVSAGNQTSEISYGIYGNSDVTVTGDTLITLGGSASNHSSYGMSFPQGSISLNADTAIAISGSASNSSSCSGLSGVPSTKSITITGGLTVAIGGFGESSRGMFSNGDINITGGSTISIGGPATNQSYGMHANKNIKITGGSGVAIAGSATTANALSKAPLGDATHVPALTGGTWDGKIAAWKVKTTQTITFANPGAQNFGTTPTLTATASSGLPVTFTSSTPNVATITSDGALAFVSAGTATINANQAGNGSYLAATEVSRTFAVNAVVPGAPTTVIATAGNGQATISFTAPSFTGGTAITGYTVTSSPGGFTGSGIGTNPITVTGLTNGTAYTFTVTATNSAGTGTASAASNSVTPQVPPPPPSSGGSYTPPTPVTKIDNGGSTTGSNLGQLVSGGKTLTVEGDKGAKLVFNTEALKGIGGQTSGDIKVEMKDVSSTHQENLRGKQVFSLTVSSGSSTITNFGGAVTVTLPYTLKEGENAEEVTVWYLASDGTMTEIPCTYDPATKLATFTVTHFSLYVVGVPWNNPFTDVKENDWFYSAVEFVSRNGMMKGIGGTDFSPNTTVTRGMLVTILWRLENEPTTTKTISFSDVSNGNWYAKAVAWAAANNIVTGYAGKFNPDDALTREQLAAISYRYAAYKNYDVSATDSLSAYADKPSDWALSSVKWAVAKGLIKGSEGSLDPTGSATRAQAATILQRFIENTAK